MRSRAPIPACSHPPEQPRAACGENNESARLCGGALEGVRAADEDERAHVGRLLERVDVRRAAGDGAVDQDHVALAEALVVDELGHRLLFARRYIQVTDLDGDERPERMGVGAGTRAYTLE